MKKPFTILFIILVLAVVIFLLVGSKKQSQVANTGDTVEFTGTVTTVDPSMAAVDGPVIVKIQTESDGEKTIAIPSMRLPLCAAFENIDDAWNLKGGETVTVRGTYSVGFDGEAQIIPCESSDHTFSIAN